jgi:hypothetical protein
MKDLTPKEKAKELYDKMNVVHYMKLHGKNKDSKGLPISMYHEQIKQCALIAVDEIFKTVSMCIPYRNESTYSNYWQEVKQEIEKLMQKQ